MKRESGITLVALIITIIVMIILAGIAISVAVGDGGVINKAQSATDSQKYKTAREQIETQCVYITKGENVGKVDLETTFDNINNLGLEEIDNVEKIPDGSAIKVTLKNGEVITIGEVYSNSGSDFKYYFAEGFYSDNGDLFEIDYENNIVNWYSGNESGKFEIIMSDTLKTVVNDVSVTIDGVSKVLNKDETKTFYYGYMYVQKDKLYIKLDEATCFEFIGEATAPNEKVIIKSEQNFYEAILNDPTNGGGGEYLGYSISGYTANGYSDWIVFDITNSGQVRLIPNNENWNITYSCNASKTSEALTEISKICGKYNDNNLATSASIPTSAQADAIYFRTGGGTDAFGMSYAIGANDELVGYMVDYGHKEYKITENVTYKVIPIITLDKDVKVNGGRNGYRIYK